MDLGTREQFNVTYKGLLDSLNDKKKAGMKYDFAHDLKIYERDNEIDTICFFRVCFLSISLPPAFFLPSPVPILFSVNMCVFQVHSLRLQAPCCTICTYRFKAFVVNSGFLQFYGSTHCVVAHDSYSFVDVPSHTVYTTCH